MPVVGQPRPAARRRERERTPDRGGERAGGAGGGAASTTARVPPTLTRSSRPVTARMQQQPARPASAPAKTLVNPAWRPRRRRPPTQLAAVRAPPPVARARRDDLGHRRSAATAQHAARRCRRGHPTIRMRTDYRAEPGTPKALTSQLGRLGVPVRDVRSAYERRSRPDHGRFTIRQIFTRKSKRPLPPRCRAHECGP